ncbi:MAG: hypothetical protein ABL999_08555 [Pyrinomonadaceae bacterium]
MKRRITLSVALLLTVAFVSLMSSDQMANAAPPRLFVTNTGAITVGPNQSLRVTVTNGPDTSMVQFRQLEYNPVGTCDGGVCKHMIWMQNTSPMTSLAPGEMASINFIGDTATHEVGHIITSNSQNMKVNAMIVNTETGQVESIIAVLIGL